MFSESTNEINSQLWAISWCGSIFDRSTEHLHNIASRGVMRSPSLKDN